MISTIEYDVFQVISVTLQNVYAPLRKNISKQIMQILGQRNFEKLSPRNIYLKQ